MISFKLAFVHNGGYWFCFVFEHKCPLIVSSFELVWNLCQKSVVPPPKKKKVDHIRVSSLKVEHSSETFHKLKCIKVKKQLHWDIPC